MTTFHSIIQTFALKTFGQVKEDIGKILKSLILASTTAHFTWYSLQIMLSGILFKYMNIDCPWFVRLYGLYK